MKRGITVLSILLVLVLVLLPHGTEKTKRYKSSFFDLFDTYTEITVYAASEAEASNLLLIAKNELTICHQLYDIYNDYQGINNIKSINDHAGIAPVKVDERIIDMLLFAKEMYDQTDGQVNIAMGSVLSLWHDERTKGLTEPENAKIPNRDVLLEAAEHMRMDDLIIDQNAMTVYLADSQMRLDVGSIAKGYATERAAQRMIAAGAENALLSVGGNIRAIGSKNDGEAWKVGVQNPDLEAKETYIATASLVNCSMVTSGSYQRYYTVDGIRYHHIIDPKTLMPADYAESVTIQVKDSGIADALSTALFTLPVTRGKEILTAFDNAQALWVMADGEIIQTDGFMID